MPSFLAGLPFWGLVGALIVVVFCRAQATYWIARLAVTGVTRSRWGRWIDSPSIRRGSEILDRRGLPILTVSFVVPGFQTVMNAAAGLARVPWWRYLLAMLPGCIAWAFIYATIGLAVFWAIVAAVAGSPWGIAAIAVIVIVLIVILIQRRRRRGSGRA